MIKGFVFIPKREDISKKEFHHHWLYVHAPLAKRLGTLKQYIQAHRIDEEIPGITKSPYEGIAEIWFDDLATAMALPQDPDYQDGLQKDEPDFIDVENMKLIFTDEHRIIENNPGNVKAMFLVIRKKGMSVDEFQDYWLNKHAPIVFNTPSLQSYNQYHTVPELYENQSATFDGVAELSWPDIESFRKAWESDAVQQEQAQDLARFVDMEKTQGLLVEEVSII